jgi:hypothetical protein
VNDDDDDDDDEKEVENPCLRRETSDIERPGLVQSRLVQPRKIQVSKQELIFACNMLITSFCLFGRGSQNGIR